MTSYTEGLTCEQWSQLLDLNQLERIIENIKNDKVNCWTKEMYNLTNRDNKCLEIGCGTGQTVGYLGYKGRIVTAVDYSEKSIAMTRNIFSNLGLKNSRCICQDAINEDLSFGDGEFDVVYSCGLLEHFEKAERIRILKKWRHFSKMMVAMIPNAASLAYHYGKNIMEETGKWTYGKELPQNTIKDEFIQAGYTNIREYTIGSLHALDFLPKRHPLRKQLEKMIKTGIDLDRFYQGYLLVTIGIGYNV